MLISTENKEGEKICHILPAAVQPIGFEVVKGWKMQVASTRI